MTKRETKLKKLTLFNCELFHTHPDEARNMWQEGFRPTYACDLKRGMEVKYRTFLLHDDGTGPVAVTRIEEVDLEAEPGITVRASTWDAGVIEADWLTEVWAR